MKISKYLVLLGVISASALLFSCGSTANLDSSEPKKTETPKQSMGSSGGISGGSEVSVGSIKTSGVGKLPERLKEAPQIEFTGSKLQIEAENMYYDGFDLIVDKNASTNYALKLLAPSSWAIAEIKFPAGSYEGVVNVFAPDAKHTRFNVCINNDSYLVYGSEPPIGKYELTTRSLVSFTLAEPSTVTLKIQQNDPNNAENNGHNGMTIDYISFKKIN